MLPPEGASRHPTRGVGGASPVLLVVVLRLVRLYASGSESSVSSAVVAAVPAAAAEDVATAAAAVSAGAELAFELFLFKRKREIEKKAELRQEVRLFLNILCCLGMN